MEAVAEQVEQKLGSIYGIVANAGITRDNFFAKLAIEDWDAVIDTNLKGVYNTLFCRQSLAATSLAKFSASTVPIILEGNGDLRSC